MRYDVRENEKYNSIEIYFDEKPAAAVLDALKNARFRWHGAKKCWYGYGLRYYEIAALINGATPEEEKADTVTTSAGYMGGGAYYGGKSSAGLTGQELKKAIMADVKRAGLRGITCRTGRGGYTDSFRFSVRMSPEDFRREADFVDGYDIPGGAYWIYYKDEDGKPQNVHRDVYYTLPEEDQEKIRRAAALAEYDRETRHRCDLNIYHLDKYTTTSPAGAAKLRTLRKIIEAYRWDESNGQVDYFSTNFYYDIETVPEWAAAEV